MRLFSFIGMVLGLFATLLLPASAQSTARGDTWRALARSALDRFERTDGVAAGGTGTHNAQIYAWAAAASEILRGVDAPESRRYLAKLMALRNPDGGWGLNYAYDAFQDGTPNPAPTTYTVTLADHVGPVFLVAATEDRATWGPVVADIVGLILSTPRIDTPDGACVAYSRHPNDVAAGRCVHNVNAGAAKFLLDASRAGFGRPGIAELVEGITRREVAAYRPGTKDWPYADSGKISDAPHTAYLADSMSYLAPPLGAGVSDAMLATAFTDDWRDPYAHMRLAALPAAAAMDPGGPDQPSRWCLAANRWLDHEIPTFIRRLTEPRDLTQAAKLAAVAARACA